jgi:NAD(P)-dependent dehydrogenase (short-subunit alcohol dehydrogenase family)
MARFDNKVLIITGGTQGIGEATALYTAELGAAGIVICGRQEEKGAAVAAAVQKLGCDAEYVRADLAIVEDCRNVVQRCDERFGRVDGLANIAADTRRMAFDECTPEFWDYQFAVNVRAPFLLSQESVRIMKREKIPGSIVNISSVASYCGLPLLPAYSSTKGAINTLTKNTANALRQDRIRVNAITLGWTDTPGEHRIQTEGDGNPENWLETAEAASPFGRICKCDDVAILCGYLLSDDSGIMTGALVDHAHAVIGVFPRER